MAEEQNISEDETPVSEVDATQAEADDEEQAELPEDELGDESEGEPYDDRLTPEELEEARANEVAFSWQASEYVHHKKGLGWYMMLVGVVAVLVVICIWQQWWIQIGLVVMAGVASAVYAGKPPRTLTYELTPRGVQIEGKKYPFSELRSFSVYEDTEWHSIDLIPTRRFAPAITMLFNSDDLEEIVGHLELHLPRADQKPDYVDRLTRYLRF
jgi:hypothetical protein